MATMKIFSREYNVIYVDPDIVSPGAGNTPASALDLLPDPTSMVENTVYLCRRSSTYQTISVDNNRTALTDSIFVIGMPLSGDYLYEFAPTEAKTAWDADIETHFIIRLNAYNRFWRITNCANLGFNRIKFEHTNNNQTNSYNLEFASSQANLGTFFMNNCTLKTVGFDLSDNGDTNNHNYDPIQVYVHDFQHVDISNNEMQFPSSTGTNIAYIHLLISHSRHVNLNDNVFYFGSHVSNNSSNFMVQTNGEIYQLNFARNDCYLIGHNSASIYFRDLFELHAFNHTIEDIYFEDSRYYLDPQTAYTSDLALRALIHAKTGNDANANKDQGGIMRVKNVTANLNYVLKKYNHSFFFNNWDYDTYNFYHYEASYLETSITDISITSPISGSFSQENADSGFYPMMIQTRKGRIDNINVVNPGNQGTGNPTKGIRAENCRLMTNITCRGDLYLSNVSFCEVNNFIFDGIKDNYCVKNENSTIYIKNANFTNFATWGTQKWLNMDCDSRIGIPNTQRYIASRTIVNNINIPLITFWESDQYIGANTGIWVNNNNGVTGYWLAENNIYQGETWSTTRTGGGSASIKLTKAPAATTEYDIPLWIAPKEFKGLQWTPGSTGNYTLKIYVALKNYSNPNLLNEKMKVYLYVPENNGGVISNKEYVSSFHGKWIDDVTSVWTGDAGLTQKVLEMPFNVDSLEPVTVRMSFSWFSAVGYLYLDPQIEVV